MSAADLTHASRQQHIDGLRGLAILMVLVFHYYSRWTHLYPYGATYESAFLAKNGYMGVQLFFMISGYVIFLTLERCAGFKEFMVRRWTRLFPAMVVATVLVYATTGLFVHRPGGQPQPIDVLPGLLFLQPELLSAIFGTKVAAIEGAFWSLYVEVKFYLLAGLLYFLAGRQHSIRALFGLAAAYFLCSMVKAQPNALGQTAQQLIDFAELVLFGKHLPWFVIGILVFRIRNHADEIGREEWAMLALSVVFALRHYRKDSFLMALIVVAVFLLSHRAEVQRVLKTRLLMFLGFVSYPLYLVHENAGVSMIVDLTPLLSPLPMALVPLVPMLVLSGVAWVLAKYLEPGVKHAIRHVFRIE